jgi:hypothetical protein
MFRGWRKIAPLFLKLFQIPVPLVQGFPSSQQTAENSVAESELPDWARRRFAGPLAELVALGFHTPRFRLSKKLLIPNLHGASVTLLHQGGEMWALVTSNMLVPTRPHLENVMVAVLSALEPGINMVTTDTPRQLDPLPGHDIVRRLGASIQALVIEHRERLQHIKKHRFILPVRTPEELVHVEAENEKRFTDAMLARGVWVMMTDEEVATLREKACTMPVPPLPPEA